MIYIYNVVSLFVLGKGCRRIKYYGKSIFLFICIMQMTFIVGFRFNVGRDFLSYERVYYNIKNFGSLEIGYLWLNKLLNYFDIPFVGLNVCMALLTFIFLIKAISKMTVDYTLSIYLYISLFFFYHAMNQTRQGLAISIGLYAISFLSEGRNKRFIFWILIGSLFHASILIMIPLIFLCDVSVDKKMVTVYLSVPLIFIAGYGLVLKLISYTKYSIYIRSNYDMRGLWSTIANLLVRIIMIIIVMILMKNTRKSKKENSLLHMAFLCTIFQVMAIYSSIFGRVTTSFFIAYIILIPNAVGNIKSKSIRTIVYFGTVVMAALYHYVYFRIMGDDVGVLIYQNYLI